MATVAELEAELAKYETARDNALTAQSYGVAGRSKTMANLDFLQKKIDELRARITRLGSGSIVIEPVFIPGGD